MRATRLLIQCVFLTSVQWMAIACGGFNGTGDTSEPPQSDGGPDGTMGAGGSSTGAGGTDGSSGTAGIAGSGGASGGGAAGSAGAPGSGGAGGSAGVSGNGGAAGASGSKGASGHGGASGSAGASGSGGAAGAAGSAGSGAGSSDASTDAIDASDPTDSNVGPDRNVVIDAPSDAGCPDVIGSYEIKKVEGTCGDLDEDAPQEIRGTAQLCFLQLLSGPNGGGGAINGGVTLGAEGTFSGATLMIGTVMRSPCNGSWNADKQEMTIVCGTDDRCTVELRRDGP